MVEGWSFKIIDLALINWDSTQISSFTFALQRNLNTLGPTITHDVLTQPKWDGGDQLCWSDTQTRSIGKHTVTQIYRCAHLKRQIYIHVCKDQQICMRPRSYMHTWYMRTCQSCTCAHTNAEEVFFIMFCLQVESLKSLLSAVNCTYMHEWMNRIEVYKIVTCGSIYFFLSKQMKTRIKEKSIHIKWNTEDISEDTVGHAIITVPKRTPSFKYSSQIFNLFSGYTIIFNNFCNCKSLNFS